MSSAKSKSVSLSCFYLMPYTGVWIGHCFPRGEVDDEEEQERRKHTTLSHSCHDVERGVSV